MLRRVRDERAPAASDIEESLAGMEPQLSADEIELRLLRLVERHRLRLEVRARVHHALVEPYLIEVVADVVMVLDGRAIALWLVSPSLRRDAMLGADSADVVRTRVVFRQREEIAHDRCEDERRAELHADGVGDRGGRRQVAFDV